MAQRVGRGIALLFHDRDTRRGCVVSNTPRPHFTPGKDPVPIVQEASKYYIHFANEIFSKYLVDTSNRSRNKQIFLSYIQFCNHKYSFVIISTNECHGGLKISTVQILRRITANIL